MADDKNKIKAMINRMIEWAGKPTELPVENTNITQDEKPPKHMYELKQGDGLATGVFSTMLSEYSDTSIGRRYMPYYYSDRVSTSLHRRTIDGGTFIETAVCKLCGRVILEKPDRICSSCETQLALIEKEINKNPSDERVFDIFEELVNDFINDELANSLSRFFRKDGLVIQIKVSRETEDDTV